MRKVFVFNCNNNGATQGYTLQKNGENLPIGLDCNKWDYNKEIEVSRYNDLIGVNQKDMLEELDKNGYYIKYPIGKF